MYVNVKDLSYAVQDEVTALMMKVQEVVEENRLLHEEIKRGAVQEILAQGIDLPGVSQRSSIFIKHLGDHANVVLQNTMFTLSRGLCACLIVQFSCHPAPTTQCLRRLDTLSL